MITMPMPARRWDQHSELIQELHECKIKNGMPIRPGFGEMVNQPLILFDLLQPLAGEDGTGAVAEQALQPGAVPRCDSDIGIEGQIGRIADLHGRRLPER